MNDCCYLNSYDIYNNKIQSNINVIPLFCYVYLGAVPTNFSYDDVKCVGTETTLNACPHVNVHDCGSNEGLWIVCNQLTG